MPANLIEVDRLRWGELRVEASGGDCRPAAELSRPVRAHDTLSQLAALTTAFAESGAWSAEGLVGWLEWGAILGDIALIVALIRFNPRRPTL